MPPSDFSRPLPHVQSGPPDIDTGSDFLVFVDESGDHSLSTIDPAYPVFVLTYCIISKEIYLKNLVPSFTELKLKYWGHDTIILHESDIRKPSGPYAFLQNAAIRHRFYDDLNSIMEKCPFEVISIIINKEAHKKKYKNPQSPYYLSLRYGLERLFRFLVSHNQNGRTTYVIAESRGKKEDNDLELEFRRILDNQHDWDMPFRLNLSATPLNLIWQEKKANSIGLQLSDLLARPIGLGTLRPDQPNRAFEIIKSKFVVGQNGEPEGWGWKVFP